MNKNIFKSIGSVIVGFVSVAFLSIATDVVLEKFGVFPSSADSGSYVTWMLALALFYRSIYTVVGGYVTARLAPANPIKHVYVLMILGGIGGVAGAVSGWSLGNHWYPVALAVSGPLFVWFGGKFFLRSFNNI
ncbi:MAG: hypothetical protein AB201_01755 [Parcubacteria bacterium C7867-006]|nr:MAG: hypothetical protein AB201_01755 [Parcubacteria bacterium C7867-006]